MHTTYSDHPTRNAVAKGLIFLANLTSALSFTAFVAVQIAQALGVMP